METDRLPRFDATPRQRAILDLIASGHTNAEIAERVGLSLAGVKYQVSELLSLAGVDSRDELGDYWNARQRRGPRLGGLRLTIVGLAAAAGMAAASVGTVAVGGPWGFENMRWTFASADSSGQLVVHDLPTLPTDQHPRPGQDGLAGFEGWTWDPQADSSAPAIFHDLPTYGFSMAEVDPQPGAADFTEQEATERMSSVAARTLAETVGVDRVSPETGAFVPAARVDGHPIDFGDLTLREFRFAPSITEYTTVADTFGGFTEPTDAWIAVWERDGVPAPEWDNVETTVMIAIVMEDGTGVIDSIQAGKSDPRGVQ